MDVIAIELDRSEPEYARHLCEQLERGNILVLKQTPFLPPESDAVFLREQRQSARKAHKNIAYKPHLQRTSGAETESPEATARLNTILAAYSQGAVDLLGRLLPYYAGTWRVDYASFRPVEEQGRNLPLRHRNDLMHLDAFPTRPTHGGRILRAFTNIHPSKERIWGIADPFERLAAQYAEAAGLHRVTGFAAKTRRYAGQAARLFGVHIPNRSPYDDFMLGFHHYLKSNLAFQESGERQTVAFAPGETWISFTDQIAHAVRSGRYALEQTCIVPYSAMLDPDLAPVAVLEKLARRPLIAPDFLPAVNPLRA